jgi:hypothetical protein
LDDGDAGRFVVPTDALGRIQWRAGGPADGAVDIGSVALWIVGYIDSGFQTITRIWQTSLNTIDVEFDHLVRYLDPADPRDGTYLAAYTLTGPLAPVRVLQSVTKVDDYTLRLWYAGELVEGEAYSLSVTGLVSEEGYGLSSDPTTGAFVAYGPDRRPIPLAQQPQGRVDIRNPQAERDAPQGQPLGTFVMDGDGDLAVETGRAYLRKRIFRRLSTSPGEMFHEPGYGVLPKLKSLYRPADLRKLVQDVESQIRQEPDVVSVRASAQATGSVVIVTLKVQDRFGAWEMDHTIMGES